ncbi:MAG: substrate-binding domain-containing protein, partial [Sinomonas sp.]|nr:substrate-binding domain-containing protein [Sinomonas sp.]
VCTPALTSVRIDPEELAAAASELLLDAIAGRGESCREIVIGTRLVTRASTGPAPASR